MRTLWRVIVRTVFWSYERGTWPYDVAVALIVLFVLASPYLIHFNDQPQVGAPARPGAVEPLSDDPQQHTTTYRVNADALISARPAPELALDTHNVLRKNVASLKDGRFQVLHIDAVRGDDGAVLYFAVTVKK